MSLMHRPTYRWMLSAERFISKDEKNGLRGGGFKLALAATFWKQLASFDSSLLHVLRTFPAESSSTTTKKENGTWPLAPRQDDSPSWTTGAWAWIRASFCSDDSAPSSRSANTLASANVMSPANAADAAISPIKRQNLTIASPETNESKHFPATTVLLDSNSNPWP